MLKLLIWELFTSILDEYEYAQETAIRDLLAEKDLSPQQLFQRRIAMKTKGSAPKPQLSEAELKKQLESLERQNGRGIEYYANCLHIQKQLSILQMPVKEGSRPLSC